MLLSVQSPYYHPLYMKRQKRDDHSRHNQELSAGGERAELQPMDNPW